MMVSRRLQKRIEHEAAEKQPVEKKKKEAATRKKAKTTRKRKVKAPERKKIFWGVFSGSLKEEGRFAYDEKDKAEERLAQLRSRGKKLYFIQPIKELISDVAPAPEEALPQDEEELLDDMDDAVDSDDEYDDDDDDDMDDADDLPEDDED